jgi:hypothetical protein
MKQMSRWSGFYVELLEIVDELIKKSQDFLEKALTSTSKSSKRSSHKSSQSEIIKLNSCLSPFQICEISLKAIFTHSFAPYF